jgi:hypothetical protein
MVYGPHVMPFVDALLAGAPVTLYEQLVTGAVWVSMPNETVQDVSAALQVRVNDLIVH